VKSAALVKRGNGRQAGTARVARPVEIVLDPCLRALAYRCAGGCPRGRTCCTGLAVEVSRREMRAIDSVMDEVSVLVPELRVDGEYENVFVDDPPEVLIEARDDGSCPFLYRTRTRSLCAIHTVALASGRSVDEVKPASCRHWPIRLERDGGRLRVTVHPAARRIGCVAPARELPGRPLVVDAFRAEILEICGGAMPSGR
jgi:hypothetical protein